MKDFKDKLKTSSKKWDVIEEFFDELGIEHEGAFNDPNIGAVFVRVKSCIFDSDEMERAMGLTPWFDTIGVIGVLTDKGEFDKRGSGWIYINYKEFFKVI